MVRLLFFLLFSLNIFTSNFSQTQENIKLVRLDYPTFIPINAEFEISLIVKFTDLAKKEFNLSFKKESTVKILEAYLNIDGKRNKIEINSLNKSENDFELSFFNNQFKLFTNTPYQIIIKCKTENLSKMNVDLISFMDDDSELKKNYDEINPTRIYKVQETAGKSVQLNKKSKLEFYPNFQKEHSNLLLEFWFKSNSQLDDFLTIKNNLTSDTLVKLGKSNLDFLSFPILSGETFRKDFYLSKGSWSYITVDIKNNTFESNLNVYANSKLVYSVLYESNLNLKDLIFSFQTKFEKENFELDRLKFWEYNNTLKIADINKHFLNYVADSSNLFLSMNFDELKKQFFTDESDFFKINAENVNFITSSAPIFSRAPKLTITIGSAYNSIIWYVQEYSLAKEFILEKALDRDPFIPVYRVAAEDDPLSIYNFTDEIIKDNEVAFYRVRQINKDNSEATSAEIKIGNKKIEEFRLEQNYPNPFNPITSIYLNVFVAEEYQINIYDIVGNKVSHIHSGYLPEGMHSFEFNAKNLPSGIYLCEVSSAKSKVIKKMILAK